MNSSASPTRDRPVNVPRRHPFFSGDTSQWLALQPIEQAEVLLAAYQERLLPELARIERLLTRLAVEYGLEYCRVQDIAILFVDVAQEIHDHLRNLELAIDTPPRNCSQFPLVVDNADMAGLVTRLNVLTSSCATDEQTSPCYAKLVDALRQCQIELAELVDLETELSR